MENRKEPLRFVKASYDRSDAWAVSKVQAMLRSQGYTVILKKSEDYEPDIRTEKDGATEFFETETKTGYTFTYSDDFPFSTVSFLARKKNGPLPDSGIYIKKTRQDHVVKKPPYVEGGFFF